MLVFRRLPDIISELLTGKMDAAYIETDVAKSYQQNYPELAIVMDVPYDTEGSAIGVCKGNEALLAGVNEAIAAAKEDGSLRSSSLMLVSLLQVRNMRVFWTQKETFRTKTERSTR